ncbi:hypothetical protein EMCRGX_G022069 [Ephydatia muelleri]
MLIIWYWLVVHVMVVMTMVMVKPERAESYTRMVDGPNSYPLPPGLKNRHLFNYCPSRICQLTSRINHSVASSRSSIDC